MCNEWNLSRDINLFIIFRLFRSWLWCFSDFLRKNCTRGFLRNSAICLVHVFAVKFYEPSLVGCCDVWAKCIPIETDMCCIKVEWCCHCRSTDQWLIVNCMFCWFFICSYLWAWLYKMCTVMYLPYDFFYWPHGIIHVQEKYFFKEMFCFK